MTYNESPEIILHIGTEKTGTTTLQQFLFDNQKRLLKQHILHPRCLAGNYHSKIAVYADGGPHTSDLSAHHSLQSPADIERMKTTLTQNIAAEIKKTNPKKITLSNEHCSSRLVDSGAIGVLKDFLSSISPNIQIVLYLRRQDEFFLSSYATAIKSGKTTQLELPTNLDNVEWVQSRYRYRPLIDRWIDVFGKENITLRVFDPAMLFENDIIQDFMKTTGIQPGNFVQPVRQNESVSADILEFLRILNHHIPAFEDNSYNLERDDILNILESFPVSKKKSVEEIDRFMSYFESENNQIAQDFFDKDTLFETPFPEENYTTQPNVSAEHMMEIASDVFERLAQTTPQKPNSHGKLLTRIRKFLN